jgi:hypothetical protein
MGIQEPCNEHLEHLYHQGLDKISRHQRAKHEKERYDIHQAQLMSQMPKSLNSIAVSKGEKKVRGRNGGVRTQ